MEPRPNSRGPLKPLDKAGVPAESPTQFALPPLLHLQPKNSGIYAVAKGPPPHEPHLEQILPWMRKSNQWGLERIAVHVDREADSLKHMRAWDAEGHKFLVRADDRRVAFRGQSRLFTEITAALQQENAFGFTCHINLRARRGWQFVAETEVVLDGAAWARTVDGKKYCIPASRCACG